MKENKALKDMAEYAELNKLVTPPPLHTHTHTHERRTRTRGKRKELI